MPLDYNAGNWVVFSFFAYDNKRTNQPTKSDRLDLTLADSCMGYKLSFSNWDDISICQFRSKINYQRAQTFYLRSDSSVGFNLGVLLVGNLRIRKHFESN